MKISNPVVKGLLFFLAAFSFSGALLGIQEIFQVSGYAQLPMYGPTLAALLFLWLEKKSIGDFLKQSFTFRLNLPILLTLAIPIVLTPCISYWTQAYWGLANVIDLSVDTSMTVFYLVAMLPAVIGEELGWRGYLLPKLQERFNPFVASLIAGVIWGFWHTPTKLMGITFFAFWFIQLLGVNFLHTFVYNKAKPSLWPAILLHYILNMMGFLFLQKPLETVVVTGVVYLAAGLLLVVLRWKEFSMKPATGD